MADATTYDARRNAVEFVRAGLAENGEVMHGIFKSHEESGTLVYLVIELSNVAAVMTTEAANGANLDVQYLLDRLKADIPAS